MNLEDVSAIRSDGRVFEDGQVSGVFEDGRVVDRGIRSDGGVGCSVLVDLMASVCVFGWL